MDIICCWFFVLCGNHGDTCKMRYKKDGFCCGDGHKDSCGSAVCLADGSCHRSLDCRHIYQRQDFAFSGSLRPCNRRILAVLFQGAAERGYQQGRSHRQIKHRAHDSACPYIPT